MKVNRCLFVCLLLHRSSGACIQFKKGIFDEQTFDSVLKPTLSLLTPYLCSFNLAFWNSIFPFALILSDNENSSLASNDRGPSDLALQFAALAAGPRVGVSLVHFDALSLPAFPPLHAAKAPSLALHRDASRAERIQRARCAGARSGNGVSH